MQESFALIHTYNIDICMMYISIYNACMFCVYIYIYMPLRKHHSSRKQKLFFFFFKVPRNGSKEEKFVFKTLICSPYFPHFPQPYACSWLPRDSCGQFGKHLAPWNALLFFYSHQIDTQLYTCSMKCFPKVPFSQSGISFHKGSAPRTLSLIKIQVPPGK